MLQCAHREEVTVPGSFWGTSEAAISGPPPASPADGALEFCCLAGPLPGLFALWTLRSLVLVTPQFRGVKGGGSCKVLMGLQWGLSKRQLKNGPLQTSGFKVCLCLHKPTCVREPQAAPARPPPPPPPSILFQSPWRTELGGFPRAPQAETKFGPRRTNAHPDFQGADSTYTTYTMLALSACITSPTCLLNGRPEHGQKIDSNSWRAWSKEKCSLDPVKSQLCRACSSCDGLWSLSGRFPGRPWLCAFDLSVSPPSHANPSGLPGAALI